MNEIMFYLIIVFGLINLVRMTWFLIGADVYEVINFQRRRFNLKAGNRSFVPFFSVVVPAYNEEKSIIRPLTSLANQTYPKDRFEVIVVDDGSKDRTAEIVREFINNCDDVSVTLVRQPNRGKAHALNNGMQNYAKGELVMCLDADSALKEDGLERAEVYFRDPKVMALSANVKIIPQRGLLNIIQKLEYLVCYQMKRAQTVFNIEYIIGGIGSTFRTSALIEVGYYDGDTVTEDIDLTMKILQLGNKENRVIYGADVIAYTESVHDIKGLIKQRFRWKWGRYQTFYKNKNLFFNNNSKYSKLLTFFYLPFAIFGDVAFFLEPLIVGYILFLVFAYGDFITVLCALTVISLYLTFSIWAESTLTFNQKIRYTILAPSMYFFLYVMSFVEYVALVKSLIKIPKLKQSIAMKVCSWDHVERKASF